MYDNEIRLNVILDCWHKNVGPDSKFIIYEKRKEMKEFIKR